MATIETRHEPRRGCGYRKQGGLYMVSGKMGLPVPCLPVPLHVCPVCNQGVKATRSFAWIKPGKLFPDLVDCSKRGDCLKPDSLYACPMSDALEADRAGLLWVGEKYYSTESFSREAAHMGVSRRISAIPKDFKIGEHWVFLGHRKAIECKHADLGENLKPMPGVFSIFKPTAIEYIVKPDDDPEKLERLTKRGVTLVDVKPLQDSLPLE